MNTQTSSIGKKIALTLLYSVALICLLIIIILSWGLGTQSGREWLANTAVGFANKSDNLNVTLDTLESPSLGEWNIKAIDVKVDGKPTFSAKQFSLSWFPKQLFDERIHFKSISAQKIDLHLNQSEQVEVEEEPKEESADFSIPTLPYIELEAFTFPNINIHRELPTIAESNSKASNAETDNALVKSLENFSLNGNFLLPENQLLQLNASAKSASRKPVSLNINSTVANNADGNPQVSIKGELSEAAGGELAALMQFPKSQALKANMDLQVTSASNLVVMDLKQLGFDLSSPSGAKKSHRIDLSTRAEIDTQALIVAVNDLILKINNTKHTGYASWDGEQVQASFNLNRLPLDIVSIWFDPIRSGAVTGTFKAKGKPETIQWSADTKIDTRYEQLPVKMQAIAQGSTKDFFIKTFEFQSDNAKVTAKGKVDLEGEDNIIVFSIANLHTDLIKKINIPLPDSVSLDTSSLNIVKASGKISGNITDPDAKVSAYFKGNYEGQKLDGEFLIEKENEALSISELSLASLYKKIEYNFLAGR